MGVVHVPDLESGPVPGETSGAEGAQTPLVGDFRKGVGLVHELRQLAGAEERVDDRRKGLGVDQVDGVELLAVADVHPLPDGAGHPRETHAELVGKLLSDGPHAAVRQVVDIVDGGLGVDQLDQVLDDLDDVIVGKHPHVGGRGKAQLLVQAVAAHVSEVVPLLGEEEFVDDVPCGSLIRRFGIAELLVDVVDSFDLRVGRILLESVEYDSIFIGVRLILLEEDGLDIGVGDLLDRVVVEDFASFHDRDGPFDRDDFTGVLVFEVFGPGLQNLGCKLAALVLLEILLVDLDLVGKTEYVDDVFVRVVTDRAEKGCYRQLLLAVDICVHHVVDVRREFNPGTLERDDPG